MLKCLVLRRVRKRSASARQLRTCDRRGEDQGPGGATEGCGVARGSLQLVHGSTAEPRAPSDPSPSSRPWTQLPTSSWPPPRPLTPSPQRAPAQPAGVEGRAAYRAVDSCPCTVYSVYQAASRNLGVAGRRAQCVVAASPARNATRVCGPPCLDTVRGRWSQRVASGCTDATHPRFATSVLSPNGTRMEPPLPVAPSPNAATHPASVLTRWPLRLLDPVAPPPAHPREHPSPYLQRVPHDGSLLPAALPPLVAP